ncbi:Deoxyhypusine hydroxylase [Hondaea fermentalgiana]|uniref:Deoxyhypusine hydroxylase n=1 Tax=Hondaea fermentalgiana TaxID=2315210 RepID=A0A2R5GB50_9STRA|nr:Deoxyhypusine hydroxylase [Hondaea fermentalgiana]|eukprot:GBG28230.1 Deoxyhypusine hydroxylase [Hondaea fermentalgiana]
MAEEEQQDAVAKWGPVLLNRDERMGERMRAVFYLRTDGSEEAAETLCRALAVKEDSSLLRHEVAYVLGQMQLASTVPSLAAILADVDDCAVVRHEAAEAMAAIAADVDQTLETLQAYCDDARPEVSETCKLAVRRLEWVKENPDARHEAEHSTAEGVDPAPALSGEQSLEALGALLMDTNRPLFERYQALFAIRNAASEAAAKASANDEGGEDAGSGSEKAILALAAGLSDTTSALFRHEVAFVLGELGEIGGPAVPALEASLKNVNEHEMVRHEAAEALGAVGTEECIALLKQYLHDPERIVAESCETALDSINYWKDFEGAATAEPVVSGEAN